MKILYDFIRNYRMGSKSCPTFGSRSSFWTLERIGSAFIYMGDRWTPKNAIDGRYVWLPILFEDEKLILK